MRRDGLSSLSPSERIQITLLMKTACVRLIPLAEREIVAALAGAASALAYLHDEVHVVHRDVKAANLLLTSAGG